MQGTLQAFTQELAARVSGLTQSQLRYLDRLHVISPSVAPYGGRGEPALYSFRDLVELKVAAQLRRKIRPGQMRDLLRQLEARGFDDPFLTVTFAETVDGHQLVYLDPEHGPLSARGREVGTAVETFGIRPRELRDNVAELVAAAQTRPVGKIESARGLHGGEPVVAGTRVPVAKIQGLAGAGWDEARILIAFPHLEPADVRAALDYIPPRRSERTA